MALLADAVDVVELHSHTLVVFLQTLDCRTMNDCVVFDWDPMAFDPSLFGRWVAAIERSL